MRSKPQWFVFSENKDETACRWFARCDNPATTTVRHPILGDVPACARCAARANPPAGRGA